MNKSDLQPFVNCHMHSSHSSLDGCGKIQGYIEKAKEFNHPALCITDHGTATGWFDFYREVSNAGLQPILGEEFYLCMDPSERIPSRKRELVNRDKHQTVLIKNAKGYRNACYLNYVAYTQGFYYKPRVSYSDLLDNSEGLIVTTGCAASMISQFVKNGREKEAEDWFARFAGVFKEDFYGEIQFNEITDKEVYGMNQKEMNDFVLHMCNKYGIDHIIGGDTHYVDKEDCKLQDIVINVSQGRKADDKAGLQSFIHARHLYYHNSDDYFDFNERFGYDYDESVITDAFGNSLAIKDKIDFKFETGKLNFPVYQHLTIKDLSNPEILREMAEDGLVKIINERKGIGEKFSNELIEEYMDRIDYELEVIEQKQIVDYFLIVQDVLNWARANEIWVGPARGSAAGCLVSYAIGITEIDPIKFGLFFERFQNPERESLPDIDCDVMNGTRDRILHYLKERYGEDSVLGVVTFQTFHAKSALQDASRGLGLDTSFGSTLMLEVNKLAIKKRYKRPMRQQQTDNTSIEVEEVNESIENTKNLGDFFYSVEQDPNTTPTVMQWIKESEETIKWADKLIGQVKNIGTHAGGILITPGPVYDYIPVTRGKGEVVTGFKEADGSSKDLSELGLLKLDILGLRTLNVIKGCIDDVKRDTGKDITEQIRHVDLEDTKLLEKFAQANNVGIFQMEQGATDLIKMIKPDSFWDLVAINGINRPGPKETFGPLYGKWKKYYKEGKPEKCAESDHYPKLDFMLKVTERTYGCLIFQEQFMQMVQEAADFNLGEADHFRRMLGWKKDNAKYYMVEKYFDKLRDGMKGKGYSDEDVEYFVEYSRKFMGYSFNLSHAVSYGYVAMQTLHLKTYWPEYFFANLLNYEGRDNYQTVISDAVVSKIEILPPSITASRYNFSVEDGKVRVGLRAINGLGVTAAEEMETLEVHKCQDIGEFLKMPLKKVNKKAIQALLDAGAFDEFGVPREKIFSARELYKEKKIETWFSRKHGALTLKKMPPPLFEFAEDIVMAYVEEVRDEEEPWRHLVTKLIPHIQCQNLTESKKQQVAEEALGFSLKLADDLSKLIQVANESNLELESITSRTDDTDLCYWFLTEKITKRTKNGKPYHQLKITDSSTSVRAKCWEYSVPFKVGTAYISNLKRDKFGYTVVDNSYLTEIEL